MALKTLLQFPICAPPNPTHHHRPVTEIRFSRWKNSNNAQKFIRNGRTQKEIEDDRRFVKRFKPTDKFCNIHDDDDASTTTSATSTTIPETFRSTGTPSTPSRPSVPGKAAKYARNPSHIHPAFRRCDRVIKIPSDAQKPGTGLKVSDDGLSYVLPNAPFPFQHSYTETPKVKPLKLREPPVAPFGPSTMPRPWTGQKPLPPSKKTLDFDSFKLPPPHKKGVKPVQAPGPFLPGSGPKYVKSREEILGDPLTKEEIEDLVTASVKTRRQLNMGRDGLTHNMLDNIHALWKRRRVCRIKCLGVCTVDMDNVCQQLEEKTGGKIIYRSGGVLYLFRGRNYNYQTRPQFPLMLWRPVTPVYPRLIQRAPEGLTLEEASEMRKKGRNLTPICKLGKNGVYSGLVNNVREAFEACELVRINCQGMTASDYRKIGGKLKDLVPCVLLSFEFEHILMWRGRDWKSSLPELVDGSEAKNSEADGAISIAPQSEGQVVTTSSVEKSEGCTSLTILSTTIAPTCSGNVVMVGREGARIDAEDHLPEVNGMSSLVSGSVSTMRNTCGSKASATLVSSGGDDSVRLAENHVSTTISHSFSSGIDEPTSTSVLHDNSLESISSSGNALEPLSAIPPSCNKLLDASETMQNHIDRTSLSSPSTEGVLILWKEAIESGSAVVLDDSSLDSDFVYRRAVALSQSAPPGPVFWHRRRTITIKKSEKKITEDSEVKEVTIVLEKGTRGRKSSNNRLKDKKEDYLDVVPQRSLGVDELAKLLA